MFLILVCGFVNEWKFGNERLAAQDRDNVAGLADFGIADAADSHVFATLGDAGLRGRRVWSSKEHR